jgi:C-terminal processing protease CtpA/Prc
MKKGLLIGLPLVAVLLVAGGYVFSQPEPQERDSIRKHMLENFPRGGYRLGVVLADPDGDGQGVEITEVEPNSPADKAGLQQGDVVVKLDGKNVETPQDIREELRNLNEAREIDVEILRGGQPMNLKVTPEKRRFMHAFSFGRPYIGVNLQNLDGDLAEYFKVDPNAGVLITRVQSDGPAAEAGIRSGDILTHINGKKVSDAESATELIGEGDSETIEVTVLRHGSEMKMTVRPQKREMFDPSQMEHLKEIPQMLNSPEFKSEMDSLKDQMQDLKRELEGLRKEELDMLREDIQKELKKEMDRLRSELKDKKNDM